jgi:hypothetical protein
MEVTCLVLSILAVLGQIGFVWYFRFWVRSLKPSEDTSEALREEWASFRRAMQLEWDETYQKMRSIAGRIDRSKREIKDGKGQSPSWDGVPEAPPLPPEILANRAMLAKRGMVFPGGR